MIKNMVFKDADDVASIVRGLLPEKINTLLILGAGNLGLEKAVFDLDAIPRIVAVEWADNNLQAMTARANIDPLKLDLRKLQGFFPPNSFDVVCMFDIVEHLDLFSAEKMIEEAGNLARKVVVSFVPVQDQFLLSPEELLEMKNGMLARNENLSCHLSLWRPIDFDSFGFNVLYDPEYHKIHTKINHIDGAMICYKTF
jgi:hypothetical protein